MRKTIAACRRGKYFRDWDPKGHMRTYKVLKYIDVSKDTCLIQVRWKRGTVDVPLCYGRKNPPFCESLDVWRKKCRRNERCLSMSKSYHVDFIPKLIGLLEVGE